MTEKPENVKSSSQDINDLPPGGEGERAAPDAVIDEANAIPAADGRALASPAAVDKIGSNGAGPHLDESAVSEPAQANVEKLSAAPVDAPIESAGATPSTATAILPLVDEIDGAEDRAPTDAELLDVPEFEDAALITRFVIGLVLEGGDELLRRLQDYQSELEEMADPEAEAYARAHETQRDRFRYFLVGSVIRNQRRLFQGIYRGWSSTGSLAGTLNRATDNWLFQPVRRPITALAERFAQEVDLAISEGRSEDYAGRVLARQTVLEFIDEFIDYMSESPELADLVRDQIGEQSLGMAGTVVENTRQVSAVTDNVVEDLVRRIFRMPKREELPPSPFVGKPGSISSLNDELASENATKKE